MLADHFTDLAVMNKTLEYPFDNSSLSVHDQQLIRQACKIDTVSDFLDLCTCGL